MTTKRISFFLCSLLASVAACSDPASLEVDDQSWDDLSSAQRRAHLEEKVSQSLETLENTGDKATWHAAAGDAIRALSLLRVEGGLDDREAYVELEAEVERLTDTPPFFAR